MTRLGPSRNPAKAAKGNPLWGGYAEKPVSPGQRRGGAGWWMLRWWWVGALAVFAGLGSGCAVRPPAPLDLARPGWVVTQAPALWTPRRGAPELSGEILLARHATEGRLVLFSKQGLPVVTAREAAGTWTIESSLQPGVHAGRGRPPARVPWFWLEELPPVARPPSPWEVGEGDAGRWRWLNSRTGEVLEGIR